MGPRSCHSERKLTRQALSVGGAEQPTLVYLQRLDHLHDPEKLLISRISIVGSDVVATVVLDITLMIINRVINGDALRWMRLAETSLDHVLHPENPRGVGCVPTTSRRPEVDVVPHLGELEEDLTSVWPRITFLGEQRIKDIEEDVH